VIGYLSGGSRDSDIIRLTPLRQGLQETGYVEGRNVAVESRWAEEGVVTMCDRGQPRRTK
jgi:putative ABC transport system substrate-binding protein